MCSHSLPVIILTIFFSVVLCRMKMFEMKKNGRYGVGFIDPNTINQKTWEEFSREDTERFLLEFLKKLNTQPEILLPYNFG